MTHIARHELGPCRAAEARAATRAIVRWLLLLPRWLLQALLLAEAATPWLPLLLQPLVLLLLLLPRPLLRPLLLLLLPGALLLHCCGAASAGCCQLSWWLPLRHQQAAPATA